MVLKLSHTLDWQHLALKINDAWIPFSEIFDLIVLGSTVALEFLKFLG